MTSARAGSLAVDLVPLDAAGHPVLRDWQTAGAYAALVRRPRALDDDARGAVVLLEPAGDRGPSFAIRVFGDGDALAREERLVARSRGFAPARPSGTFTARHVLGCRIRYHPRARAALLQCDDYSVGRERAALLARPAAVLERS
jgi:hypothetical protein